MGEKTIDTRKGRKRKRRNIFKFSWWFATLVPLGLVVGFAIAMNYPFKRPVSISLRDVQQIDVAYRGTSVGSMSPVCGCMEPNPYEWRGITFVFDAITLGTFDVAEGKTTGYRLSSPIPQQVGFGPQVGWDFSVKIFKVSGTDVKQIEDLLLHDVGDQDVRAAVVELQSRKVYQMTIVANDPIEIRRRSDVPVAAWIPIEGSSLQIERDSNNREEVEWQLRERLDLPLLPETTDEQGQIVVGERSIQHPILDMVGTKFLFVLPKSGQVVFHNPPAAPISQSEDPDTYAVLVEVPYSLRVGIQSWIGLDLAEALSAAASRPDGHEMIYYAHTPSEGEVEARVIASHDSERLAVRELNREEIVAAQGFLDMGGQSQGHTQMVMRRPPIPRMPGTNMFGPMERIVFRGAQGDIVVGAEPLPSFNAPSEFELEPEFAAEGTTIAVPVVVGDTESTISSEFASLANLKVNGTTVTIGQTLLTGAWRDIVNLGSVLAAVMWLGRQLLVARRR